MIFNKIYKFNANISVSNYDSNYLNHPNAIKIEVTDLKLNTITNYDSIHAVSRSLSIGSNTLSNYLKRNQKSPYRQAACFKLKFKAAIKIRRILKEVDFYLKGLARALGKLHDGSRHGDGLHLSVYAFSNNDVDKLMFTLQDKFNFKCSIHYNLLHIAIAMWRQRVLKKTPYIYFQRIYG